MATTPDAPRDAATRQPDEIDVLIRAHRKERSNSKWVIVRSIDEVPATCGHYALYDGRSVRGCGVTYNMQASLRGSSWYGKCEQPICMYLPDDDGSAALWLEGKIRCRECHQAIDIDDEDRHYRKQHGRDLKAERRAECTCADDEWDDE